MRVSTVLCIIFFNHKPRGQFNLFGPGRFRFTFSLGQEDGAGITCDDKSKGSFFD